MNYIDLTVLLIFVLSVLFGFKKGFLKTVTGLAAMVLSLVLATTFYPYAAELMLQTPIYGTVYENAAAALRVPEQESDRLSDYGVSKLNLPRDFLKNVENNIDTAQDAVVSTVADAVASAAVKLISMLSVFLLVRVLLLMLTNAAGLIRRLPVIGWGDSLLGALFGLFRGLLIIYVLLAFVTFASSVSPDSTFFSAIKYSKFAKVMYHDNVLLDFICKD